MHSYMALTCLLKPAVDPTYFVTELTRVTPRLQQKDLRKIGLGLFALIISHMTVKFRIEKTDPTAYVTNMFKQ